MEKKYNVLWFEDEYEKLENFQMEAALEGIILSPFRSAEEGIEELQKNYTAYDAVLMDAKFFLSKDDKAGSEGLSALGKAKSALDSLSNIKKFDVFVLTGQAKLFEDTSFESFVPKYYKKGLEKDIEQLISDIKSSANKQIDTQIKHKHQRVFEVCTDKYIGEQAGRDLLDILKNQDSMDSKKYLNTIRNIIEDLYRAFNKFELLPLDFVSGNIDLNPTCRFLIGMAQKDYQLKEESRLPSVISHNLWSIINHSQPGSHRSYIDEHISSLRTPYLFNTMTFQLLDVLIWFKDYVDKKPKKKNWKKGVSNSKKIEKGFVKHIDNKKGDGLIIINDTREEIYLAKYQINQFKLNARDRVEVSSSEYMEDIAIVLKKRINKVNKL